MVGSGFSFVIVLYLLFVVVLAVLAVSLIVLVFHAIRVLRLSATERELRIERLRYPALFEDGGHPDDEHGATPTT